MGECEYCGIEKSFLYVCPECGGKFCNEHKSPENHNCHGDNYEEDVSQIIIEDDVSIKNDLKAQYDIDEESITIKDETGTQDEMIQEDKKEYDDILSRINIILKSRARYYPYIIGGLLFGLIFANLLFYFFNPLESDYNILENSYQKIKTNYNELFEKNSELQNNINQMNDLVEQIIDDNTKLISENNALNERINEVDSKLNKIINKYDELFYFYNKTNENLFKYISLELENPSVPSTTQFNSWLSKQSEMFIDSDGSNYSNNALLISLAARSNNWSVGIIEIVLNSTAKKYTYNVIYTTEGLAYINSEDGSLYISKNETLIQPGMNWQVDGELHQIVSMDIIKNP